MTRAATSLSGLISHLDMKDISEKDAQRLLGVVTAFARAAFECLYIVVTGGGKTTTVAPDHIFMIARLEVCQGGKILTSGGGAHLPSEYFGHDSGRYFTNPPAGHRPWVPGMTRTGLFASNPPFANNMVGGGTLDGMRGMISESMLTSLLKQFNTDSADHGRFDLRLSKEARGLLCALLAHNTVAFVSDKVGKNRGVPSIGHKDAHTKLRFSAALDDKK